MDGSIDLVVMGLDIGEQRVSGAVVCCWLVFGLDRGFMCFVFLNVNHDVVVFAGEVSNDVV